MHRPPNRWRDSRTIEENVKRWLSAGSRDNGPADFGESSAALREMAMKATEYKARRGFLT
jgi:hypothetical protein